MKKFFPAILCSMMLLLLMFSTGAQKVRLIDGSLDALKGVTKMNIRFDYAHMGVGKFDDEADYISKKKGELNEKEPGRGTSWEKAWIADRKNRFEPQFKELFMKHSDLTVGDLPNEKYTLIFKTTYTEPGFNVYVAKKERTNRRQGVDCRDGKSIECSREVHGDECAGAHCFRQRL